MNEERNLRIALKPPPPSPTLIPTNLRERAVALRRFAQLRLKSGGDAFGPIRDHGFQSVDQLGIANILRHVIAYRQLGDVKTHA